MRAFFFVFSAVIFSAFFTNAQAFRCSTADSYSNPCPSSSSTLRTESRYKTASGTCGNGSAKTVTLRYCASKFILAAKLESACMADRQCGNLERKPIPRIPLPVEPPHPLPVSYPTPVAPKEPPPPVVPQPVSYPKPVAPTEPPPPVVPQPVSNPIPVIPKEPPPPVMPPLPTNPPAESTPQPVVPTPPPSSDSAPVTTSFKGSLTAVSTEATAAYAMVTWTSSELVSNYCGTGVTTIHYVKLDKVKNAAFFSAYSSAQNQFMSVSLVCPAPAQSSSQVVEDRMGGRVTKVTKIYPDGCTVSNFVAAQAPPRCMIP